MLNDFCLSQRPCGERTSLQGYFSYLLFRAKVEELLETVERLKKQVHTCIVCTCVIYVGNGLGYLVVLFLWPCPSAAGLR